MNTQDMNGHTSETPPLLGRLLVQTRAVQAWSVEQEDRMDARLRFLTRCIQIHASQRFDLTASDEHDQEANRQAVISGARVLTSHLYEDEMTGENDAVTVWVITDSADEDGVRQGTTLLFPQDY